MLVLSLFPGADLLGIAFELEGFCVVQGPDVQFGRDVREFHPPGGAFAGVIGGPPCQAFSQLKTTGTAENLIPEFERVVAEARPDWFVMENVRQAPLPEIEGYDVTAQLLNNRWLGEEQSRLRRFSFGFRVGSGRALARNFDLSREEVALENPIKSGCFTANGTQWEPGKDNGRKKGRSRSTRTITEFRRGCRLQGLPDDFLDDAPFTVEGKIRLIGNGVPIPMGRAVARAVKRALRHAPSPACAACGADPDLPCIFAPGERPKNCRSCGSAEISHSSTGWLCAACGLDPCEAPEISPAREAVLQAEVNARLSGAQ